MEKISQVAVDGRSKKVQVYDPPMCCSSGVCGPNVDPVLPRFAADLEWLKGHLSLIHI